MRKFVVVVFVGFTASVFGLSGMAQRRARGRGHRGGRGAAAAAPTSPRIAQELGAIRWGWTHDQVLEQFRRALTAEYQPRLRNQGQVEQDRLMQERDRELNAIRSSYVHFNGLPAQRRWDSSFIGTEYTHNNGESMLVREDPQSGNREFFFFFNDHLWKRFQARALPRGGHLDYPTFVAGLEQLFGNGQHINDPEHPERLKTVVWQDSTTRLHTIDNSTFFNAFCLVYDERATVARLDELRHNQPTKNSTAGEARPASAEPQVGNVEGDSNEDIVDRITGKMRRVQNGPAPAANAPRGGTATPASGPAAPASTGTQPSGEPLRGL